MVLNGNLMKRVIPGRCSMKEMGIDAGAKSLS